MAPFKEVAILHNPSFDPKYDAQFDITCLQIVGNRASFGGSIRKTSDPVFNDEFDAAFFTVFDNGEPGAGNDTISEVFFDNVVEPSTCQFIGADDFPQIPIESGNVQVTRSTREFYVESGKEEARQITSLFLFIRVNPRL